LKLTRISCPTPLPRRGAACWYTWIDLAFVVKQAHAPMKLGPPRRNLFESRAIHHLNIQIFFALPVGFLVQEKSVALHFRPA
jgi:hypothetical protein